MSGLDTPPSSVPPTGSGTLAVLLALAGGAIGLLLTRLASGHTEASRRFAERPEFEIWSWIVAAELAAAAAFAVVMWPAFRHLVEGAGQRTVLRSIGIAVAVGALLLFGPRPVSGGGHSPLWLLFPRLQLASAVVGILIAPAFFGLLLIQARLSSLDRGVSTDIAELLWIRQALQRFLVTFAVLVSGGVLAAGAMRIALLVDGAPKSDYPVDAVLVYGGVLTAICALLFVPTYVAWQERVSALRDRLLPLPAEGLPPRDWYQARSDFDTFFAARSSAASLFYAAFSILAPLTGSLVAALIPTTALP